MKRLAAIAGLSLALGAHAENFTFVALGDTAYNGERDYGAYRRLIDVINESRPAFTIHVGDIWGVGNCHDWHMDRIAEFFARYDHPVVYTPGDNEWVDCHHRAMGGYEPVERLVRLRNVFFAEPRSLGRKPMNVVRQADVSPFRDYVENSRWQREGVLFVTLNVPGSHNNFLPYRPRSLAEAHERMQANVAWLRDSFRLAREAGHRALVVALHAEMFYEDRTTESPYAAIIHELRLGAERFAKPVLLVHGDSHEFVVDRPLIEPRGEADLPRYANIMRLEVYGAPEIRAVRVRVEPDAPWVFGFEPLYIQ